MVKCGGLVVDIALIVVVAAAGVIVRKIEIGGGKFVFDDSTVKGKGGFFGGLVRAQMFVVAYSYCDLCLESVLPLGHATIPGGVFGRKFCVLCLIHEFVVIFVVAGQSSWIV